VCIVGVAQDDPEDALVEVLAIMLQVNRVATVARSPGLRDWEARAAASRL